MSRPARTYDDAKRTEALRLLEEGVGAAEIQRRLDVPSATIRSWAHRAGRSGPPKGTDPETWAARKAAGAQDAWDAAQQALEQVRDRLKAGKAADAQRAALAFAILTDKSGVLEEAAERARERQVRVTEEQAQQLVDVTRRFLVALGLPAPPECRPLGRLMRALILEQADPPADVVAGAREGVRAHVLRQVEHEQTAKREPVPEPRQLRALPAPSPPHPDGREDDVAGEVAAPRTVVRAVPEQRPAGRANDSEPVVGEVVDEVPQWPSEPQVVRRSGGLVARRRSRRWSPE